MTEWCIFRRISSKPGGEFHSVTKTVDRKSFQISFYCRHVQPPLELQFRTHWPETGTHFALTIPLILLSLSSQATGRGGERCWRRALEQITVSTFWSPCPVRILYAFSGMYSLRAHVCPAMETVEMAPGLKLPLASTLKVYYIIIVCIMPNIARFCLPL